MSNLLRALIVLPFCLPLCTQAHMQMSWPYPLRSSLDPAVPEQYKDYSVTNPLNSDGSNFPCKHYQNIDTNPQAYDIKATYQAGNSYNLTLVGGATHSGGSCQISISYDNGASFKVLQSIIGGCPLAYTYDFTIPSFAPSSDSALLSWSWFNLIGNREMYQNCARVQIQGAPVQRYRRTTCRRQTSMNQLPDMFSCNVGNGCTTIENSEVVFPNPGPNVIYGQDAVTPNPGPGFVITGSNSTSTTFPSFSTTSALTTTTSAPFPVFNSTLPIGPTGSGFPNFTTTALTTSSSSSLTTSPTTSVASSTTTQQFEPVTITITVTVTPTPAAPPSTTLTTIVSSILATSTPSTTSTTLVPRDTSSPSDTTFTTLTVTATSPSSSSSSTSTPPLPCTPGTFYCNSASTFSTCSGSGTSYIYMGSVAAGMTCVNGQIIRQNAGPCTPNGQIFCNGNNAFYMCDQGGLISMGPVTAGTVCRDGVIVAA